MSDGGFPVTDIALDGGTLCVFTDGVTEWRGDDGRMLGVDAFEEMLRGVADAPLDQRLARVMDVLERPDGALHDDLTILLVAAVGRQ